MTFLAPRWGRVLWPTGVMLATFLVVSAVIQLSRGDAGWSEWLQLGVNVFWGVACAWLSHLTFRVPSVRMDEDSVSWRAMVSSRFQSVKLRDLVGYRMQDSFDLRLQLQSGEERSIHLSQVTKRDRGPLVGAIAKIVKERTEAI